MPSTKWTINFDFTPKSLFYSFFFFPRKPIKFYVSGRSQNEFIFFFSLTSELKSQLFTQLHIKMAWNCLIVHVVSYLLCDLITTLLILALSLSLTVVEFCSKSNRRLLQEDVLPSHTSEMGRGEGQLSVHQWYISGTGLIPLHIRYKGCPIIAFPNTWMLSLSLQVTPNMQDMWTSIFSWK